MSRNKITFCQGCPASGKTTWAKKQDAIRINRDDIRRELFNFGQWKDYKFTRNKEDRVTKVQRERLVAAAAIMGQDVIDDNTNLNDKYLRQSMDFAKSLGFDVEVKPFFGVHLHELIERNINREFSVPESTIHDMFRRQLELQGRAIKHDSSKPSCVVVDVDGTVAEMRKGHKDGRSPYEWEKVHLDLPKNNVIDTVNLLHEDGNKIIFLTGRDGVALEGTIKWLNNHLDFTVWNQSGDMVSHAEVYIREAGNMEPDCVIKERLLNEHVLPRYNVSLAIDDRDQMVHHYRALGLECWQVAAGRF